MLINVTTDDILLGVRMSASHCPVARAIKRKFLDERVKVANQYFWIGESRFKFNEESKKFIVDFDSSNPVEPFSFNLSHNPTPTPAE